MCLSKNVLLGGREGKMKRNEKKGRERECVCSQESGRKEKRTCGKKEKREERTDNNNNKRKSAAPKSAQNFNVRHVATKTDPAHENNKGA